VSENEERSIPEQTGGGPIAPPAEAVDPFTAMTPRFVAPARAFGDRFFSGFRLEPSDAARIREVEGQGAVVYVMRYASRLDYFLFNWLFIRENLRLPTLANGIRFYYYRPLLQAIQTFFRRLRFRARLGSKGMRALAIGRTRAVLRSNGSMFLFLRTDKIRYRLRTRRRAVRSAQSERDYLREVVATVFDDARPVYLVPLALFWRKGPRTRRRFLNLFYGAPERPTDTGKVISFLWNYRNLAIRVGTPIDLCGFVEERRAVGVDRLAKQVRRVLLIFLRREEKPVSGSALRPLPRIAEFVLGDPEVKEVIAEVAAKQWRGRVRAEGRARRYLREIAAHPSPTMLAILDSLVTWMFRRLFERVEVHGLDRVEEAAKLHPLVLVPCHRSHFDYLIVSWLFYERHLVPPLVAAGLNLSFWPLGPVFRRAGAFFLRRTFEGDRLYATVFRSYVRQLIKDGATQEFFIEGTRSRSGRTLAPRLGMLGMVLEAYARGVRRDVYVVPVGFTYERLVEEGSIVEERGGARKTRESVLALLSGWRVLRRRHGTVIVRFGEPVSLADRVSRERSILASSDPANAPARREITERFGFEICRELNALLSAGRAGVAAAALLSHPVRGVSRQDLGRRMQEVARLLVHLGVPLGEVLEEDLRSGDSDRTIALLEEAGLVQRVADRSGEILTFDERARTVLDYYRGSIVPALSFGGALAFALQRPAPSEAVLEEASRWLDLLELEVLPPEGEEREERLRSVLAFVEAQGVVQRDPEGALRVSDKGSEWLELLMAQVRPLYEAYRSVFEAVLERGGTANRRTLEADARALHTRHLLLGEASFPEGLSLATLSNGLAWLVRQGFLDGDANLRRADARVQPGRRWEELAPLAERVAAALTGR
jgi:glycerol-3-phosphate O-acyltransferase